MLPSSPCEGVTVCIMSVLGVKPGKMGDSVMLSRFEKGSAPITIHIPTSKQQVRRRRRLQHYTSYSTSDSVSVAAASHQLDGARNG